MYSIRVSDKIEVEETLHPTGGIPYACIKQREGKTVCGRSVDEGTEFLFTDAAYAVRCYKNNTRIVACPDCVALCEAAGVGAYKTIAPMSTRGMTENNK
jgi:hypothetical protein